MVRRSWDFLPSWHTYQPSPSICPAGDLEADMQRRPPWEPRNNSPTVIAQPGPISKTKTDNCPELWMYFLWYVIQFRRKVSRACTVSPPIRVWSPTIIPEDDTAAELWPSIYKSFFRRIEKKKFKHIFGILWVGGIFRACLLRLDGNSAHCV